MSRKRESKPNGKSRSSAAAGGSRKPKGPPSRDVTWQAGAARLATLAGFPDDMTPPGGDFWLVLGVEEETQQAVGGSIVEAEAMPGAAAELLLQFMAEPMIGEPRRPRTLLVHDEPLAAVLREELGGDEVEVRVEAELPLWDAVVGGFVEQILANRPSLSYLADEEASPERVGEFFQAAADFYSAAPWKVLADDPIELHLPGSDQPVFATVMGSGEMEYGLSLHFSAEELADLLFSEEMPEMIPDALAVTFEPESELPESMREERKQHRWTVAGPTAYPLPMRSGVESIFREPTSDELALLTSALEAVRKFAHRHASDLADATEVIEATIRLQSGGEALVVFPALLPLGDEDSEFF
jgi:hypothetical protein